MRLGLVTLEDLRVTSECETIQARVGARAEEFRADLGRCPVSALDEVQRNRRLWHSFGADPTRDRPPPERLLRAGLKGSPFPRENSLVDAMNLVSLSLQCPVGAYDPDKITPPVLVRIGFPGESRSGSEGGQIVLAGKPVLADGVGPFGGPGECAGRAAVGLETVRAVVVAWVPADTSSSTLDHVLEEIVAASSMYCGGRVVDVRVVGRGRAA